MDEVALHQGDAFRPGFVEVLGVEGGAFAAVRHEALEVCWQAGWLRGISGIVGKYVIAAGCDPIDCVGRIAPIPKLFICGTDDRIVSPGQTRALYEAAAPPKELWVLPGTGHTEALIDNEPDPQNPVMSKRDRFCAFLHRACNGSVA